MGAEKQIIIGFNLGGCGFLRVQPRRTPRNRTLTCPLFSPPLLAPSRAGAMTSGKSFALRWILMRHFACPTSPRGSRRIWASQTGPLMTTLRRCFTTSASSSTGGASFSRGAVRGSGTTTTPCVAGSYSLGDQINCRRKLARARSALSGRSTPRRCHRAVSPYRTFGALPEVDVLTIHPMSIKSPFAIRG